MATRRVTKHRWRTAYAIAGVFACALLLAGTGCGGGGASGIQTGTQTSATLADHLTLALSQDKATLKAGDTVTYKITLTNPTAAPVTDAYQGYHATGPVTLDMLLIPYDSGSFHVQDTAGNVITHDGMVAGSPPIVPPRPVILTLQPGQSLSATETYTLTRPGVYSATASLENADLSTAPAAGPLRVTVH